MIKIQLRLAFCALTLSPFAAAEVDHPHLMHHSTQDAVQHPHQSMMTQAPDMRETVVFPAPVYDQTLKSMREHLRALNQVSTLTAAGKFEAAALATERGLGIGHQHGVEGQDSGHAFMPEKMAALGQAMHSSARDLALILRESEVTEDYPGILGAMAELTDSCVACHDAYRLEPAN